MMEASIDYGRLHRERLARVQGALRDLGVSAVFAFSPLNLQYATYPGIAVVSALNKPHRWALIPVEGRPVMWESFFAGRNPHSWADGSSLLDERPASVPEWFEGDLRQGHGHSYFPCGSKTADNVRSFADEIMDVLAERGLKGEKIAIDRLDGAAFAALTDAGLETCDGDMPFGLARTIKTVDELALMRANARSVATGLDHMRGQIAPGVTENQLWGSFIGTMLADGAERFSTRMLSSGPRTNPWYQEATDRVVQDGELIGIDTDMPGRGGYVTDVSRTYLCGDRATDAQRRLYHDAYRFVDDNLELMRPGTSYKELAEVSVKRCPPEYFEQRYVLVAHSVGMCDEFPAITWSTTEEGHLEPGMVICVEAYCGLVGGIEGVKVEEQVIITEGAPEIITSCVSHDEKLMR
jgi:Xaa-Pro dipeptidase